MDIYSNLGFSASYIARLRKEATDHASTHGLVMRSRDDDNLMTVAPFTLLPSPYPAYLYHEAWLVQTDFQTLAHRASRDRTFIQDCLASVCDHDDFTKRTMEIYKAVQDEGIPQKFFFNMTRSDYMIDASEEDASEQSINNQTNEHNGDAEGPRPYENRQIEINMIAASFAGLDSQVAKMHRYMADAAGDEYPYVKEKVPVNNAIEGLGEGLAKAWLAFGNERAAVVFVIMQEEKNSFDQRHLEYSFHDGTRSLGVKHHVPVLFRTLQDIGRDGELDVQGNFLLAGQQIALFYFRAGYGPDSYAIDETLAWSGRLLAERSTAIKCPDVASQLIGTKKVQQVFSQPGAVERFIDDPEAVKRIRRTFAGLYSLDPGAAGDEAERMALQNPSKYVLKPQREGGGNNMYDEEMVQVLQGMREGERSQYILMERVATPAHKNIIIRPDAPDPRLCDVVSELGVFGYFLSDGSCELENRAVGYLMRSKSMEHADGGVAAGRAVLDSPHLV